MAVGASLPLTSLKYEDAGGEGLRVDRAAYPRPGRGCLDSDEAVENEEM